MTDTGEFDLVEYRLEQAEIALDDAKFLINGKRSPQSIINRSYYAMFYAALALLQKAGKVPTKHRGVISVFDTEFVASGVLPKELSRSLHKAFELRQVSDYKVMGVQTLEDAEAVFESAVDFVDVIGEYLRKHFRES